MSGLNFNKMKKLLLLLPTLLLFAQVNSQPLPDSVIARYNSAQSAEEKGRLLFNYLDKVLSNNDSNFLSKSIEIQSYFTKLKDETGSDITGIFIANEINNNGDYSTGLNMALLILSNVEKRNDNYAMAKTLQVIARCYDDARNYDQAIEYLKKAIPIAIEMNDKTILSYTYNSLGAIYAKEFMPDSGLFYGQKAVILDTELKDENHLGFSVSTVAENYIANKDYDLAMPFLRRALKYAIVDKSQQYGTAYIYNDFAQAFQGTKQLDSSNYYANLAIPICLNKNYKEQLLRSYEYLYQNYDVTKQQDSINKYFRLAMTTKDSLYSFEKLVENICR